MQRMLLCDTSSLITQVVIKSNSSSSSRSLNTMELIARRELMMMAMILMCAIAHCADGGEIRRGYVSPYDTINKVSFTQRGYIQFLKYLGDMPPLSEFTFCVWMRSDSFNFSHPLFSYSRNEQERMIRVWVSDGGVYVNMAILEVEVFRIPINVRENHWNHYCPSWNAKTGTWSFYYNGKLIQSGLNYKLQNIIIPGQGDIVVGQEYTDFNKGLDDGIEGDIYAFNFVASATSPTSKAPPPILPKAANYRRQMYIPSYNEYIMKPTTVAATGAYYAPDTPVLGYFTATTREPKGLMEIGQTMLKKLYNFFDLRARFNLFGSGGKSGNALVGAPTTLKYVAAPIKRAYKHLGQGEYVYNALENSDKTLGMFLVELSYDNCMLGRGSPLADDKVVVSWTKTPVRVFGGAILKTVVPFCKKM